MIDTMAFDRSGCYIRSNGQCFVSSRSASHCTKFSHTQQSMSGLLIILFTHFTKTTDANITAAINEHMISSYIVYCQICEEDYTSYFRFVSSVKMRVFRVLIVTQLFMRTTYKQPCYQNALSWNLQDFSSGAIMTKPQNIDNNNLHCVSKKKRHWCSTV